MLNWLRSLLPPSVKAEGEPHPGPWMTTEGLLPATWGSYWNWWQMGHDPIVAPSSSAMVEACISAYAQTIAMCPGSHWRTNANGGRERITTSALARLLKRPNTYQSISDFLLNGVRSLYSEGNAYALALRNDRFEINELHLMRPRECHARIAETGDVFYSLAGNEIIDNRLKSDELIVPARDVLHIRLHTGNTPLKGESPLTAAMSDVAVSGALTQQQLAFFLNQ